jgi:glycosyltransferase involved in cell wall biosynthesis
VRAEIATTDADGRNGRLSTADLPANLPVHMFERTWSEQWKVSLGLRHWLARHAGDYDIVHIHSVWSFATAAAARAAQRSGVPYVVRPAGVFSGWAMGQRRWKKQLAWHLYHRRHLASAAVIHATSDEEAMDVRGMGLTRPIAVIPNGVAFEERMLLPSENGRRKRVLFLSRIHPVKGLANLIDAWRRLNPGQDWELVIAGPDEGRHRRELEALASELGLMQSLRFVGPVSEREKWKWYCESDVFVLPSFAENFSVSVAEALSSGLPVITTTGTPWRELRARSCGWWIEPTADALADALGEAMQLSDEDRAGMGRRGADWVRSRFSWPAVAAELHLLYRWMIEGGTKPEFVQNQVKQTS